MCGRATLTVPAEEIAAMFDVDAIDIGPPRFNLAPTQPLLTVRAGGDQRALALVRWGLIPWWAKADEAKRIGARCVQARSETAQTSPAYRDAFKKHRCLVVVDGFYEWQSLPDGKRVPFHVRRADRRPFAIAGLWDRWRTDGTVPANREDHVESGSVLTTRARGELAAVHDRMPLVLAPDAWETWLRAGPDEARALLKGGDDDLVVVPVSTWVNDVKHDDATCVAPEER